MRIGKRTRLVRAIWSTLTTLEKWLLLAAGRRPGTVTAADMVAVRQARR
jgi:hypothetical protein